MAAANSSPSSSVELTTDPFLRIPYWSGAYPQHPSAESWHSKAIYQIAMVGLNIGVAKKYPLKQMFAILTRKHLLLAKGKDLTLCRRIGLDEVGGVYSNLPGPNSGKSATEEDGTSPTGFVVLTEAAGAKSGKDKGWGGDIAIQASKGVMKPFLDTLLVLIANAKNLSLEVLLGTFAGTVPAQSGGAIIDVGRVAEASLLTTALRYTPVETTRDPRLSFLRLETMFAERRKVQEKYEEEVRLNPQLAVVPKTAATKEATPTSEFTTKVLQLKPTPVDLLPFATFVGDDEALKYSKLYAPLACVATLWFGLAAVTPQTKTLPPSQPQVPQPPPTVMVAFLTREFLYFAIDEFEVQVSIPVVEIRKVLVHGKKRRGSAAAGTAGPSQGSSLYAQSSQSMFPEQPNDGASKDACRVKAVLVYYDMQPPVSVFRTEQQAADATEEPPMQWKCLPSAIHVEFESEMSAVRFFSVLRSLSSLWSADQMQLDEIDLQVELERGKLFEPGPQTPPPQLQLDGRRPMRSPRVIQTFCPLWRRDSPVEKIAFRVRLFAFYERYAPGKVTRVDKVVWNSTSSGDPGACDDALQILSRKYGPEPDTNLQDIVNLFVDMPESDMGQQQEQLQAGMSQRTLSSVTSAAASAAHPPASRGFSVLPGDSTATLPPAIQRVNNDSIVSLPRSPTFINNAIDARSSPSVSFRLAPDVRHRHHDAMLSENLLRNATATPGEKVAAALGRSFESASDASKLDEVSNDRFSAAASGTDPVSGATIGDVLKSYGFSVTFFDRFAAMYFPEHLRISSGCTEADKVRMFEKLMRAYAPNEDSFYAALVARAQQKQQPAHQLSPVSAAAASYGSPSASSAGEYSPNALKEYEPQETVNATSVWGRHQAESATAMRRFATMSRGTPSGYHVSGAGTRLGTQRHVANMEYGIAPDDLKALVMEPLSGSLRGPGEDAQVTPMNMLPPMFSGKKPEGFLPQYTTKPSSSAPYLRL